MQAAYTAAASGDTILIGPGYYTENPSNFAKRVIVIGAGWDQTYVNLNGNNWFLTTGSNGTVIEGIHLYNNYYYSPIMISGTADSITIRRCVLEKAQYGAPVVSAGGTTCRLYVEDCILIQPTNSAMIELPNAGTLWRNCIFAQNYTSVGYALMTGTSTTGTTEIYNSVFLNARTVFSFASGAQPIIAINNVFYDWGTSPSFGTYPTTTSIFDYNASTSAIAAPGTNAIALGTTDPFVNYDESGVYVFGTSDLHLATGSPLIDAGHPNLTDFLDATRSDCGIYGGPRPLVDNGVPNYPWAVNIIMTPNLVGQGTPVTGTAIGRVGPQY
jgi:hypothetical protein